MKAVRSVALVALGFLAVTAIFGAALLMLGPMGSPIQIPVSMLKHSPFHSFLIPAILLLVSSGLLGTATFLLTLFRVCRYGWWVIVQGGALFIWITTEVVMLRHVVWLHYLYWGLAVLLLACGWILREPAREATPAHGVQTASGSRG